MRQPPSGGCVLKQKETQMKAKLFEPAAFGRLCVETFSFRRPLMPAIPSRLRAAVC